MTRSFLRRPSCSRVLRLQLSQVSMPSSLATPCWCHFKNGTACPVKRLVLILAVTLASMFCTATLNTEALDVASTYDALQGHLRMA